MAAKSKIVVGLDIGTTKVCAVVAGKDEFGKINILGVGKAQSEGLQRASVVNITKTVAAIKEAIAEAEQTSSIKIKGVNVGVSGEHIQCIKSNAEISINPTKIVNHTDVMRFTDKAKKNLKHLEIDREIIHAIPQEFIVDDQEGVLDPIGMAGDSMKGTVYTVIGMKTKIRNIGQCIEKAGLVVNAMTFEPIASALAIMKESERKSGVAIIDIGGGTTDMAVYTRGVIRHSAVIKVAAMDVTNDVAIGLKTLHEIAEELKVGHGCAYSRDLIRDEEIKVKGIEGRVPKSFMRSTLTTIIEARMTEIFEMARTELKKSGYFDYLNAGAIITGGGSLINGTQALAQEVLGMDVRIGHPEGMSGGVIGETTNPIYATAVGLVMQAFKDLEMQEEFSKAAPVENSVERKAAESKAEEHRDEKVAAEVAEVDEEEEKPANGTVFSRLKNWFDQI